MIDSRQPQNVSETRRALSIGRPGVLREVFIDSRIHRTRKHTADSHYFDVSVHPKSKLTIYVYSGIPFLKLRKGTSANVRVVFESTWGNSLDIDEGQGATVIVPWVSTKVTIGGDDADLKLEIPEAKNRVRVVAHDCSRLGYGRADM